MSDLAEIKIKANPVDAVEALSNKRSLNDEESGSIMRHLIEGGDLSAWGYVNAITATAKDASPDRRHELEVLAGNMTANPEWAEVLV
jgi:hypothetical protein